MRVIVAGARDWGSTAEQVELTAQTLSNLTTDVVLVLNDSKGASAVAEYGWVQRWRRPVEKFTINWNRRGPYYDKGAAYRSADAMLSSGADVVMIFGETDGVTTHLVDNALKRGIPVHFYREDRELQVVMPSIETIGVNPLAVGVGGNDPW